MIYSLFTWLQHAKKKDKVNDIAMLYLAETVTRNGKTKKIKGRFSTRLFDLKVQQDIYPDCVIIDPIKLKGTNKWYFVHQYEQILPLQTTKHECTVCTCI
jgi:uncharacterized protein with ParB-like and HNH nuclease domain